jgi:hypothetical protein
MLNSLFRSYLEQREQMVQIKGQETEPGVVRMGVVQCGVYSSSASYLDDLFGMINEDIVLLRTWLSANMLGT